MSLSKKDSRSDPSYCCGIPILPTMDKLFVFLIVTRVSADAPCHKHQYEFCGQKDMEDASFNFPMAVLAIADVTSPQVPSSDRDLPWLHIVHQLLLCPTCGPWRHPVS
jgi:hypothetical protein